MFAHPQNSLGGDPTLERLRPYLESSRLRIAPISLNHRQSDEALKQELINFMSLQPRHCNLVLGGFSLGARIALQIREAVQSQALLFIGFPFHERGNPKKRKTKEDLGNLDVPTLIVQGSRDSHGNRETILGYHWLPPVIQIHWVENANHRLIPKASSMNKTAENMKKTGERIKDFVRTNTGNSGI